MIYLTPADTIEAARLSVRSQNALHGAGVHTIADLLSYDRKMLKRIRNLGAKSLGEVFTFIDGLRSRSGEVSLLTGNVVNADADRMEKERIVTFRDASGLLRQDIPLEKLGLSCRSHNGLKKAGYDYASQLIGITEKMLLSIRNLGAGSAAEIMSKIETLVFYEAQAEASPDDKTDLCVEVVTEITKYLDIHGGELYQELLPFFESTELGGGTGINRGIYEVKSLRDAVKLKILESIQATSFGMDKSEVLSLFPDQLFLPEVISDMIDEMESDGQIKIGSKIERRRMTILEYAHGIPKEKEREFLLKRLRGLTLDEIGSQHGGITRERVRQVILKCLRGRPLVAEDRYRSLFEKYDFSRQDFSLAFGESDTVYHYLSIVCAKRGTLPVEQLLTDESFSPEIRRGGERVVYKKYITVGGERIYKKRANIADYVVRTYFQDEASFDDFTERYNRVLEGLGLSEDRRLALSPRTYENRFRDHDLILWKRERKFRYYNIESLDCPEFLQELAFEQYKDAEYSSLKLFRDNPSLMRRYDIRDEYELHNLLKKICRKNGMDGIDFGRMPMIAFGNADRDNQVLDMLIRLAPVSVQDLAAAYEDEYGVLSVTFMAVFLKNLSEYCHNGICDISMPSLEGGQFTRMGSLLTEDYYETAEVKRMYAREFPGLKPDNINPYTLKTLGFNVFATYVIKKEYPTAAEYIRNLLTKDDLVDARDFPPGLTGKGSYSSELIALKDRYEIVEYEPFRYINIRRLNREGVTVARIKDYCGAVADYVGAGVYFTVRSLNNSGFAHGLYELGFGEVFYASLLTEASEHFSYLRMGGTKLFHSGTENISLRGFLESILARENDIGIFDLLDLLNDMYDIKIDRYKIVETVKNSPMYYDSIMGKVYMDYDAYQLRLDSATGQ